MFYYENTSQKPKRVLAGEETFNITFPTIGPTNISSSYLSTIYSNSELGYYVRTSLFSSTATKDPDKLLKVEKNLNYINGNGKTIESYGDIFIENLLTTGVTKYTFLNRCSFFDTGVYEGIYGTIYESLDKKTVTVEIFFYMNSTDRSKLSTIPSTPNKNSEYEHYRGRQYDYLSIGNTYDIVNIVKYENDTVYGRPFSLSVTNRGTTTTVTRTSSPNEHATQTSLSNGDIVYYGDVLSISVSAESGYGEEWIENKSTTSLTSAGTRKWTVVVTKDIDLNFYTYKEITVTLKKIPQYCTIDFSNNGLTVLTGASLSDRTTTVKEGSTLVMTRIECSKTAYNLDYKVAYEGSSVYSKSYLKNITKNIVIEMTKTLKTASTVWSGSVTSDWFRNGYASASFSPSTTLLNQTLTTDSGTVQRITFSGKVTFGSKTNQSASHTFSNSGDWSGTLTHTSWTGNIAAHAYPTYVEFDGNNMGAYYGRGTITAIQYLV